MFFSIHLTKKLKEAYCKTTNKQTKNGIFLQFICYSCANRRPQCVTSCFDKHPNISWGFAVSLCSVWESQTRSWWFKIFSAKYLCHIFMMRDFLNGEFKGSYALWNTIIMLWLFTEHKKLFLKGSAYDDLHSQTSPNLHNRLAYLMWHCPSQVLGILLLLCSGIFNKFSEIFLRLWAVSQTR